MLIDFRQFLYDSVEKVVFKAEQFFFFIILFLSFYFLYYFFFFFFFLLLLLLLFVCFFCMTEMQRQTLAHNLNIQRI